MLCWAAVPRFFERGTMAVIVVPLLLLYLRFLRPAHGPDRCPTDALRHCAVHRDSAQVPYVLLSLRDNRTHLGPPEPSGSRPVERRFLRVCPFRTPGNAMVHMLSGAARARLAPSLL